MIDNMFLVIESDKEGLAIKGLYESSPSYVAGVVEKSMKKNTQVINIPVNKKIDRLLLKRR